MIVIIAVLYIWWIKLLWYLIDKWYTNSDSATISPIVSSIIPSDNRQVYKYLSEHPTDKEQIEKAYSYLNENPNNKRFPQNNWWLDFVVNGIDTRKSFIDEVEKSSSVLWIDKDMVLACVLWEQIRIANKWARGKLKDIVINSTPTLFRSYNVSLWIGGIKIETAYQIKDMAIKYWYWDWIKNEIVSYSWLADNDRLNAKFATYQVKNIITRRKLAGYDISKNPWVVCTIYNIWNREDKKPNNNPQIWWSIIRIWNKDYVYWWLAMWVYWYLKIYR